VGSSGASASTTVRRSLGERLLFVIVDRPQQRVRPVLLDAADLSRCRHRVYLDHTHARPEGVVDAGVRQRQADAAAHRQRIGALLIHEMPATVQISAAVPVAARVERTLQAAAAGAERIWGPVLPLDVEAGRRGRVELLIRHGSGYLPVLVVNHRTTDPGSGGRTSGLFTWDPQIDSTRSIRSHPRDQLRLAHLTRMLQRLGLAADAQLGGAIGLDGDCIVVHDLAAPSWPGGHSSVQEYDLRFADRLAVVTGDSLTQPSRIGECRSCLWWSRCHAELQRSRDVSLVVQGAQATLLRDAGISTVDQLAAAFQLPTGWFGAPFADAVVLAKAWQGDFSLVRRTEEVRIQRADVEVDVDMESYLEHGAYLWGTLLSADGVDPVYRPFGTWDPLPSLDEGRSFAGFWTWLMTVRAAAADQGKTFAAYCYSEAAENRWLLASAVRFAGMAGVPTEVQVREFIGSAQWVDVYAAVSAAFLCPQGKGLKKVAPVAGFAWRDADAGGEASMGWYRAAVGMDGLPEDPTQRQRLLDYNADDVWATKVLREWMSDRAAAEVPLASEL